MAPLSTGTSKNAAQGVSPMAVPEDRLPRTVVVTRKPASRSMWGNDVSHPSSPKLVDTMVDEPRLTKGRNSRHSRLHNAVPASSSPLTAFKHSAIPAASTHDLTNNLSGQDVRELDLHASPSPATHLPVSTSQLLGTHVSSIFNSVSHHGISPESTRLRTPNQVFQTGEELALHYGIPTLLPPPPKIQSKPDSKTTSPIVDFDTLRNNYLNMISQKPSDNNMPVDTPLVAPTPAELLPSSHMDRSEPTFEQLVEEISCGYLNIAEYLETDSNANTASPLWEYLTSPAALGTPAGDFESSPDETPFTEFLNTPLFEADDFPSPSFQSDLPLFAPADSYFTSAPEEVKDKSAESLPELPDTLIPMPPESIDPTSIYPSPTPVPGPTTFLHPLDVASPSFSTTTTVSTMTTRRRSNATGTRKNLTTEKLIPLDAPTQARRYLTPSSTSRKEVPATFARKRQRAEMEEGDDELEPPPPNATEKEMIEYKRRQNTIAARKSRARKLQHQQELESNLTYMTDDRNRWRTRCEVLSKMLESNGIPPPTFSD